MRKFKLLSHDEKRSFSLHGGSIIVTEVTGLGTKLEIKKSEGSDRYYISNVNTNFEDITLKMYFGVNGNTYTDYNNLLSFIALNGKNKIILEYDILGVVKYCDIWLTNAPKTQKDETSTMNSTFTFNRLSHWYNKIELAFSLQSSYLNVDFPMEMPLSFIGNISEDNILIENSFFEDYHLNILAIGPLTHDLVFYLNLDGGSEVSRLVVKKELVENEYFRVNGETKKVTYYNAEQKLELNGYNYIDRNYDSFISVPNGNYRLGVNLDANDTCQIVVSYKQWVLD